MVKRLPGLLGTIMIIIGSIYWSLRYTYLILHELNMILDNIILLLSYMDVPIVIIVVGFVVLLFAFRGDRGG